MGVPNKILKGWCPFEKISRGAFFWNQNAKINAVERVVGCNKFL